jgi:hypothetical protein
MELVAVMSALTERVSVRVFVVDSVTTSEGDRVRLVVAVREGVGCVAVLDSLRSLDSVGVSDTVFESVTVSETEELSETVGDRVAVSVGVELAVTTVEIECDRDDVGLCVCTVVGDCDDVRSSVIVIESLLESEDVAVLEAVLVSVADLDAVRSGVGVFVVEVDRVGSGERVFVHENVRERVTSSEEDHVSLEVSDGLSDAVGL